MSSDTTTDWRKTPMFDYAHSEVLVDTQWIAGHIPGAVNVNYELALNDDGTFKSINELQALYDGKGITADKDVITYCAIGGRSGHTWFVLKYLLGYPHVRNYDGSWNEWSRLPGTPMEK